MSDRDLPRSPAELAVVIIGRNEGERLVRCLHSCRAADRRVVYVDSGSTDGSLETAADLGAEVVRLDTSTPFTAARARNAGLEHLLADGPAPELVQFIDGDCELDPNWLTAASGALTEQAAAAVVAGRRRERFPEQSIYNELCDIEWDTPVGLTEACGGDLLARVKALDAVHGFRETMIAGEEPELCLRLRQRGWEIWRLDREMTLHDAAIERFGQWWRRARRAGHAFAETAWIHGSESGRLGVRPLLSMLTWALGPVLLAGLLALLVGPLGLAVLLVYPLQGLRIAQRMQRRGIPARPARLYAAFVLLAKPAQVGGAVRFVASLVAGRERHLIEYKGAHRDGAR